MEVVRATYLLDVAQSRARERAEELALEQTVELPRHAIFEPRIEHEIVPRVESLEALSSFETRAVIAFPLRVIGGDPAQLLTVLFGNCSLQPDVTLADVSLPPALLATLGGPRFGAQGLRARAGVPRRPLSCTALKPMGLDAQALGELCELFARAGLDLIKDDHGLGDQAFCPFEDRLHACLAGIERAALRTGRRALYVPNLSGGPAEVTRKLALAERAGARAVLVEPSVLGLPALRELALRSSVPLLAHPALAGGPRVRPELWLGTLYRLYGADAVIYPHCGGRFQFDEPTCRALAHRLGAPLGGLAAALPVPAGGMSVERVPELVRFYGREVMLLIGGSLYEAKGAIEERARAFAQAVACA